MWDVVGWVVDRELMSDSLEDLLTIQGISEFSGEEAAPCVYFLVHNDAVIYVGQTQCLITRLKNHRRCFWNKSFDRVFYLPTPKEALLKVEFDFIIRINPKNNHDYEGRLWRRWNPQKPFPTFESEAEENAYMRWMSFRSLRIRDVEISKIFKKMGLKKPSQIQ